MKSNPPKLKVYDNFKNKDEQILFLETAQNLKKPKDLLTSLRSPLGTHWKELNKATSHMAKKSLTPSKLKSVVTP